MSTNPTSLATFGGGCFWCLEAVFELVRGVKQVTSGYAGGRVKNPSYREVCAGKTGHAEVVQIAFDENIIDYGTLLNIFFFSHDPTTIDRQGNDKGPQYRSIILHHDAEQKKVAEETIRFVEEAKWWSGDIVTELVPLDVYYPAEDYHQSYYSSNSMQPYCQVVISPKIAKLRGAYAHLLSAS